MSRGGEVGLVVLAAVLLLLALAALIGLGSASALFGGGWVWPSGSDTAGQVLAGLLTGEPGRGLPAPMPTRVPGSVAVYSSVAAAELLMLAAAGSVAALFWRYHRPGDARGGMATRSEAQQVLGRSRLRQARTIIRPDLYGTTGPSTLSGRGVVTHSRSAR
jgi:hypothetical protein